MRALSWWKLFVALGLGVLAPTAVLAHHGVPGYDFTKPVNLEGRILAVNWRNPHVYFTVDTGTRGAAGKPRVVEIECASPGQVVAFGTRRELLKPGTQVKVLAFGRIKDPDGGNYKGATITLPDGSTYFLENTLNPALVAATVVAQGLAGKWVPASVSNFTEYMTAEAKSHGVQGTDADVVAKAVAAIEAAGVASVNSCARLANESAPFLTAASGGLRTIEIGDKSVTIRVDGGGGVTRRVVDLTQATHPANIKPTPVGHSIGRWEGKTLVIDTAAFTPNPLLNQGARKHLVERLTLTDDRRHLHYEFTVADPDYYAAPFRFSMLWTHRPDLDFSGAACDDKVAQKYLSVK
jgi:hypothetical protein